jgi:hypothetical protein
MLLLLLLLLLLIYYIKYHYITTLNDYLFVIIIIYYPHGVEHQISAQFVELLPRTSLAHLVVKYACIFRH